MSDNLRDVFATAMYESDYNRHRDDGGSLGRHDCLAFADIIIQAWVDHNAVIWRNHPANREAADE